MNIGEDAGISSGRSFSNIFMVYYLSRVINASGPLRFITNFTKI
jgi:hypothetical protein